MYILGISSSPRAGGNSDLLLDEALRGAAADPANRIEKVRLAGRDIKPCTQCDACLKLGLCIIQDEMVDLYPKLEQADRLFFAAPIYFMGVCAQAKLLIDRCQVFWARKQILKKDSVTLPSGDRYGVFISAAGTRVNHLFSGATQTLRCFFRTLGLKYADELLIEGVDEKAAVEKFPDVMRKAYELGRRWGQNPTENG